MIFRVVLLPLAEFEIFEAVEYYETEKRGLGFEFLDELEEAKKSLSENPQYYSYISLEQTLRRFLLNRFPYKLIYEIQDDQVIIYAVRHGRQKPLE